MKRDPESKRDEKPKRRTEKKRAVASKRNSVTNRNATLKQRTGKQPTAGTNGATRPKLKRPDRTAVPTKVTTEACMPNVIESEMSDHAPATQV
ncbi:MAG: hypothetical protein RI963_3733, partial [Planctomycetota bacterium]